MWRHEKERLSGRGLLMQALDHCAHEVSDWGELGGVVMVGMAWMREGLWARFVLLGLFGRRDGLDGKGGGGSVADPF